MDITRQQQLLSLIKRIVSSELQELNHEQFHSVVVTHVHLNNSGRECRVYVKAPELVIELLNTQYRSEIHRLFMKKFVRKVIPKLIFTPDMGDAEHLEALIAQTRKDSHDA